MADRVVGAGRLDEPGQQRGLGEGEVLRLPAEVAPGGCLDAVGAVAEVDEVQVALEDLLLRQALLDADRQARLPDLAADRVVGGGVVAGGIEQGVLDVLLGERAATLRRLTALDVGDGGPQRPADVDGTVVEEAGVLDRDHRLLHDGSDPRERDGHPVLVVEPRDDAAVGGEQHARAWRGRHLEHGRQPVERLGRGTGEVARAPDQGQRQHRERETGGNAQHEQPGQRGGTAHAERRTPLPRRTSVRRAFGPLALLLPAGGESKSRRLRTRDGAR